MTKIWPECQSAPIATAQRSHLLKIILLGRVHREFTSWAKFKFLLFRALSERIPKYFWLQDAQFGFSWMCFWYSPHHWQHLHSLFRVGCNGQHHLPVIISLLTPNHLSCSKMSFDALHKFTSASDFQQASAVSMWVRSWGRDVAGERRAPDGTHSVVGQKQRE